MPTYQYKCKECGNVFEEFQRITEDPLTFCPKCGKQSLARVLGTGSGVIFKGSGFYLTDYKREKPKGDSSGEKKEAKEGKKGNTGDTPKE
jgi:putative FmdB family regulatory protein